MGESLAVIDNSWSYLASKAKSENAPKAIVS